MLLGMLYLAGTLVTVQAGETYPLFRIAHHSLVHLFLTRSLSLLRHRSASLYSLVYSTFYRIVTFPPRVSNRVQRCANTLSRRITRFRAKVYILGDSQLYQRVVYGTTSSSYLSLDSRKFRAPFSAPIKICSRDREKYEPQGRSFTERPIDHETCFCKAAQKNFQTSHSSRSTSFPGVRSSNYSR